MRFYLFRSTPDIPVEEMTKVADRVSQIFNIDYSMFTGTISCPVEQTSIEDLLSISDRFLERGEPVVAIVFTREGIQDDEFVLGQGSPLDRGAWVRWTDNLCQITITTVHELGHIFEAEHCADESCIMFHTYRKRNCTSMRELFCKRCLTIVENSWIFNRLRQATEDRRKRGQMLPKIVRSMPTRISPITNTYMQIGNSSSRSTFETLHDPFPDWSLAQRNKTEFIERVIEYFGYRRMNDE
ncbi:MAG: hypothetical protein ACUVTL_05965 [Thermoproteota archaeon]